MRPLQPLTKIGLAFAAAILLTPVAAASAQADMPADEPPNIWQDADFKRRFTESYIAETDIEPKVTAEEREQLLEVYKLFEEQELGEALTLLEQSKTEASSAVYYFFTANIHLQQERFEQAALDYTVAVEKFPKFRRAWRNLGLVQVRRGNFDGAREAFSRVIELGGGDADTYGLLGYCYSSAGNNLSAESAYRMANLLAPEEMNWKMGLVRSFFMQQRYADVASLCGTLIKDDPDNADLWMLQANAYIGLEKPMKAAENYEVVDRLGKSTVASLGMLGDIYTNEGLFEAAVNAYIRTMERAGDSEAPAVTQRVLRAARVIASQNQTEQTKLLIEMTHGLQGDTLTDDDKKALLKLQARIAVAEGAGEDEVRVLEEIVALDPLDGEALILLGQHAARAQDYEQAIFRYEQAQAIEAYEADAKVRHAQALVAMGKYAEALPLLRSAQQIKYRENIQDYLEQVERISKAG